MSKRPDPHRELAAYIADGIAMVPKGEAIERIEVEVETAQEGKELYSGPVTVRICTVRAGTRTTVDADGIGSEVQDRAMYALVGDPDSPVLLDLADIARVPVRSEETRYEQDPGRRRPRRSRTVGHNPEP